MALISEIDNYRSRRMRKWWILRLIVLSCVLWILTVDRVEYIDGCYLCNYNRVAHEYRILGVKVCEEIKEAPSFLSLLAADLGVACPHLLYYRHLKRRLWGLFIPAFPSNENIWIIESFAVPNWYDDAAKHAVRRFTAQNHKFVERFREALVTRRRDVLRRMIVELRSSLSKEIKADLSTIE